MKGICFAICRTYDSETNTGSISFLNSAVIFILKRNFKGRINLCSNREVCKFLVVSILSYNYILCILYGSFTITFIYKIYIKHPDVARGPRNWLLCKPS